MPPPILPDSSKVLSPSFIQCIPNHGTSGIKIRTSNTGQNSQSGNRRVKAHSNQGTFGERDPNQGIPFKPKGPVKFVKEKAESRGDSSLNSEGR
jgi:hypothetical protein